MLMLGDIQSDIQIYLFAYVFVNARNLCWHLMSFILCRLSWLFTWQWDLTVAHTTLNAIFSHTVY